MESLGKNGVDSTLKAPPSVVKLEPIEATPDSFQEFGQVIEASPDGGEFGPSDAQLDLSRGTPRFYIMRLEDRDLKFSNITHHANVTQCLGSIGGHVWYLGVAKPSIVEASDIKGTVGGDIVQSRCGHFYVPPSVDDVRAFRISGSKLLKLNRGTWHAGPLFKDRAMDFYNLELSNTNVVDHTTHDFIKNNNAIFVLDDTLLLDAVKDYYQKIGECWRNWNLQMEGVCDNQEIPGVSLGFGEDQYLGLIDISHEDDDLLAESPCFRSSADSHISVTFDTNKDENGGYNSLQPHFSQLVKHKAPNLLQDEHERQLGFVPETLSYGRPSLAWDSAFFTDDGVLDEDELTLMNEGLNAAEMRPIAHKDVNKQRVRSGYSKTVDAFSSASRKINACILNRTNKSASEGGRMSIQRSLENKPQSMASKLSSPLVNLLSGKSRSASVDAYRAKKESRAETLLSVDKFKLRKKSAFENSCRLSSPTVAFGSSVFPRCTNISTHAAMIKSEKGPNSSAESNSGPNSSLDLPLIDIVQTGYASSPVELVNYQSTPDAYRVLGDSRGKIRSSHLRMPSPKMGFFDEGKSLIPTMQGSIQFKFETQGTPPIINYPPDRRTNKHLRSGMSSETKPLKQGSKSMQPQHPVQEIGRIRSEGKLRRQSSRLWNSGKTRPDVDLKLQSGTCGEGGGEWICSKCQKIGSDVQDRKRVGKVSVSRQDDEKRVKARLKNGGGRQIGVQRDVPKIKGERRGPAENEQQKPNNLPSGSEDETRNFENQVNDLSKYFEVIDLSKVMRIENEFDSKIFNFKGENDTDNRNQENPKLFRNESPFLAGDESSPSSTRTPLADKTSISNRSGSIPSTEKVASKSWVHACSGKENSFPRQT
ncbi:OLC1v1025898C1 [Oldenlandia corymbosa var. corymbosa]|uniref:OLC1v1025898C1 n=1 Tax=Oldenlandia corymbosa var. corymbosa TaxID=529605 RepID=A0AAV1C5S6_OLDCO|nr:OLC1v1025898C1 [Oldenlandia corymbosa var. corymbosa]